jgi:hypothetical protein
MEPETRPAIFVAGAVATPVISMTVAVRAMHVAMPALIMKVRMVDLLKQSAIRRESGNRRNGHGGAGPGCRQESKAADDQTACR